MHYIIQNKKFFIQNIYKICSHGLKFSFFLRHKLRVSNFVSVGSQVEVSAINLGLCLCWRNHCLSVGTRTQPGNRNRSPPARETEGLHRRFDFLTNTLCVFT